MTCDSCPPSSRPFGSLALVASASVATFLAACGPSRFMLCVVDSTGQVHTRTYDERLALDSKLSGAISLRDEAAEESAAHDIPCPREHIRLVSVKHGSKGRETTLAGCGTSVRYVEVCTETESEDVGLRTCGERLFERAGLPAGRSGSNPRSGNDTQM